ncbi:MAG: adenosine deaminase [Oligoflexales bacterium]|nr:adenosine deaminase [Oligoflexales bacterium]
MRQSVMNIKRLDLVDPWIKDLPKIELHCHLEGAFPVECLWELIEKYESHHGLASIEVLKSKFAFSSFADFVELWIWKNGFLRSYEDFTFIADAFAKSLVKQNVFYSEIFFSPSSWLKRGFEPGKLLEAIYAGYAKHPNLKVQMIADLVRNFGPENEMFVLEQLKELRSHGLIGIGLGGSEQDFPAEHFSKVFDKAKDFGFKTTAHAGEFVGPESIWQAINHLKVDRLGHALCVLEDESLINYLQIKKIGLELCPYSNYRSSALKQQEVHPLKKMLDLDLLVTLNSDDPLMFGHSLNQEYQFAQDHLLLTKNDFAVLLNNSLKVSWLSNADKLTYEKFVMSSNL